MSATEWFTGQRYDIVAFAYGEKNLYYDEFGHDDGESMNWLPMNWLLLGRGPSAFSLYRGEFGYQCSYCGNFDPFSREFDRDTGGGFDAQKSRVTRARALDFVRRANLNPFVTIPDAAMQQLCEARTLVEILPAHLRRADRGGATGQTSADAAPGIITAVKLEMGWPLVVADVLEGANQELRSRALAAFGHERLVREAGAEIVDRDGDNELLRVRDMVFVHVKDASTPRRYVLRVPPRMQTVREAIAWTFGFGEEDDYGPTRET
jgi:hypothetical protein